GLWGSRWSVAPASSRYQRTWPKLRPVHVVFGPPMPPATSPEEIKKCVQALHKEMEMDTE
ncbi:MAG: hypothetical protein GX055_11510, partial [Desulfovibrionales bacterium]|nr:hypothetical protein [Desulfovibrionales bacterium]